MSFLDELIARFPAVSGVGPGCYAVGGAVRDLLHERDPVDLDLACPDPLAAAQSVGGRVIRLGDPEHLSAWRVVSAGHVYDFAGILDDDIQADLARRDFTINAMAVDLGNGELLDPHGGRADLAFRVVRMIDPSNFDDDPLRTLKGVRMAVALGFEIDPSTLEAMQGRAERILDVAPERVAYELSVIFSARAFRRAVALLRQTGLAKPLGLDVGDATFHADDVSLAGAFALLVRDARAHARRWRWSEALRREVVMLQSLLLRRDRVALYDAGEAIASQLIPVLRARGSDDAIDLPDFSIRPLLTGDEIADLAGIEAGREVGAIKRGILEAQIRGEIASREDAEEFVRAARTRKPA